MLLPFSHYVTCTSLSAPLAKETSKNAHVGIPTKVFFCRSASLSIVLSGKMYFYVNKGKGTSISGSGSIALVATYQVYIALLSLSVDI